MVGTKVSDPLGITLSGIELVEAVEVVEDVKIILPEPNEGTVSVVEKDSTADDVLKKKRG